MIKRFVVSGTDTGVGKTVIAAGLAGHLGARYWTPIQAGLVDETDSEAVRRLTEGRAQVLPEAWRLTTPCSPHEAARIDGVRIDPAALALPKCDGPLVVEGAGGLLVPIAGRSSFADLARELDARLLLVVGARLGAINHALLSLEAAAARGIPVAGFVVNHFSSARDLATDTLAASLRELTDAPLLAEVGQGVDPASLLSRDAVLRLAR